MKKYIILLMILAAGLTAYPQSSRSSSNAKSSSSRSASKSVSSKSSSASKRTANQSSTSSRPKTTQSKSSSSKAKATQSRSSGGNKAAATQSRSNTASRSQATQSRSSNASRSQATQGRSSGASKSQATQSRSSGASRSQATQGRSSGASRSQATQSRSNTASKAQATRSNRSAVAVQSRNSAVRSTEKAVSSNNTQRINTNEARSRSSVSDSYNRGNRQGNKVYQRNDGEKFRHQNDEYFASRRYRVDYRDISELRRSRDFVRRYNECNHWYSNRYRRNIVVRHYHYGAPLSLEIRRMRYPYRHPVHLDLCWTPYLHQRFVYYYPMHNRWNADYGSYIETVTAYDAMHYVGSVKRVYGKVEEVYYSEEDRTYTLYFGAPFPYHDFSVVIPRNVAKDISWSPTWHFEDEHVWAVGLIDIWEDKPEIVIHDRDQIRRY